MNYFSCVNRIAIETCTGSGEDPCKLLLFVSNPIVIIFSNKICLIYWKYSFDKFSECIIIFIYKIFISEIKLMKTVSSV